MAAIESLRAALSSLQTEDAKRAGLAFKPDSSDLYLIASSPAAGTAWVQQIAHQLRTGGDEAFEESPPMAP